VFLWLARTLGRSQVDEVVKLSLYRADLFGAPFIALVREIMRGPSQWTAGERELFGAFVSRLNRCRYCSTVHTEVANLRLDAGVTAAQLNDWHNAGFDPRITATFELLEKVTLAPSDVRGEDVARVRAHGVTDEAIVDALHVAFVFNVINRIANALDFRWQSDADVLAGARVLNRLGYRLPGILLR
jgi:uncharacterized peroxidase-related enzyme